MDIKKKSTLLTKNAQHKNNLVRHFSQKLELITKNYFRSPLLTKRNNLKQFINHTNFFNKKILKH